MTTVGKAIIIQCIVGFVILDIIGIITVSLKRRNGIELYRNNVSIYYIEYICIYVE